MRATKNEFENEKNRFEHLSGLQEDVPLIADTVFPEESDKFFEPNHKKKKAAAIAGIALLLCAVAVFSLYAMKAWRENTLVPATQSIQTTAQEIDEQSEALTELSEASQDNTQENQAVDEGSAVEQADESAAYDESETADDQTQTVATADTETTQALHCTNVDNHSASCGNCGMWFDSYEECEQYINQRAQELALEHYNQTGTIISPVNNFWQCEYCGKWTDSFDNY